MNCDRREWYKALYTCEKGKSNNSNSNSIDIELENELTFNQVNIHSMIV